MLPLDSHIHFSPACPLLNPGNLCCVLHFCNFVTSVSSMLYKCNHRVGHLLGLALFTPHNSLEIDSGVVRISSTCFIAE